MNTLAFRILLYLSTISITTSLSESIGKKLIDFRQTITEPFYWVTENLAIDLFCSKDLPSKRSARIFFHSVLSLTLVPEWVIGNLLRTLGTYIMKKPYYYIAGEGREQETNKRLSLLTFNVCMYESGLPMVFGGVMPARERVKKLAAFLEDADADVVLLQEMSLGAAKRLFSLLKEKYAHVYTNIGPAFAWIYSIGPELMILSKAPLTEQPPEFVPYKAEGSSYKLGFFCLETPLCWIINAHFPGKNYLSASGQKELLQEIVQKMKDLKAKTGKPCILAGDLNIRRTGQEDDDYTVSGLQEMFYDYYTQKHTECCAETSTCTNLLLPRLLGEEDPADCHYEIDDYILVDMESWKEKKIGIETVELIQPDPAEFSHPKKALSDHKAYKAIFLSEMKGPSEESLQSQAPSSPPR